MPTGIKLSNQLYPATGDQILSQAQYIHDSQWQDDNKDQQSINSSIKQQIDGVNGSIDIINDTLGGFDTRISNLSNEITNSINALAASRGLKKIPKGGSIGPTFVLNDTVYKFGPLDEGETNKYSGFITSSIRGDANGDFNVDINDVVFMVDKLLNKGNGQENELTIMLDLKNTPFEVLVGSSWESYQHFKINLTAYNVNNRNSEESIIIRNTDSELEKIIKIYNAAALSTIKGNVYNSTVNIPENTAEQNQSTEEDEYPIPIFEIKILGYYNDDPNNQWTNLVNITAADKIRIPHLNNYEIQDDDVLKFEVKGVNQYHFNIIKNNDTEEEISQDISIVCSDPDNIFSFDVDLDGYFSIGDITALIDYLLKGSWVPGYQDLFSSDCLYLFNNESIPVATYPGIVYQMMLDDGSVCYLMSKNYNYDSSYNRLYPIKMGYKNIDTNSRDLIKWLNNLLIVSDDLEDQQISSSDYSSIRVFVNKKDRILSIDNPIIIENPPIDSKILNVEQLNSIVTLPIFLYTWDSEAPATTTVPLKQNYSNKQLKITLSDNSNICLVDNLDNEINELYIDNITSTEEPICFIKLKIKEGTYITNQGFLELENPIQLYVYESVNDSLLRIRPIRQLNCRIPISNN